MCYPSLFYNETITSVEQTNKLKIDTRSVLGTRAWPCSWPQKLGRNQHLVAADIRIGALVRSHMNALYIYIHVYIYMCLKLSYPSLFYNETPYHRSSRPTN